MQHNQLADISQAGLQLAIQEIKEEMFDTPECDYTIAKLLSHCGQFEAAERRLDDMLLKWGSSPDVLELTKKGHANLTALSAIADISRSPSQVEHGVLASAQTSTIA
ncbi:hypothetical protein P8S55_06645 [Halomonas sp. M1]|uniref:hypothetical protein n=1 Tax=Halomonas sp. M1 TaxID=3035470 RepID=UPI0024851C96|nr:hypothetical protein [Halomonas sp. M1]WFE72767.1 hypothetical protein P8S55_06645 [Halomonas sp. M1]